MEQRIYETRIITLAVSQKNGIEFLVSLSPQRKINNPYYKLREFYLEKNL